MEKLTTLASSHSNDVETIQKLQLDLEKLTTQKKISEEKEKKHKDDYQQVNISEVYCEIAYQE